MKRQLEALLLVFSLVGMGTAGFSTPNAFANGAGAANTRITGQIGAIVDPGRGAPTSYMRYVGSPPDTTYGNNYSNNYQRGAPYTIAFPEANPVVMKGVIDLSSQSVGSVGFLGFSDAKALAQGGQQNPDLTYKKHAGYQGGAYVYIYKTASQWEIALSDGNLGGDLRQVVVAIPYADMPIDRKLSIEFTVDGSADPNTCHDGAAGVAPAGSTGCMTLKVSGQTGGPTTIKDSYGAIKYYYYTTELYSHAEFQFGAVPSWDNFSNPSISAVNYDVVVDVDGISPTISTLQTSSATISIGQSVVISTEATPVGVNESVKKVEISDSGSTWQDMTAGENGWSFSVQPSTVGVHNYCVRATDGLSGTIYSDEISSGTDCVSVTVNRLATSMTYTGENFFSTNSVLLRALLEGGCSVGQTVDFLVDLDSNGVFSAPSEIVGSSVTDGSGEATFTWTVGLLGSVYDLKVSFDETSECYGAYAIDTFVIAGGSDASTGGGFYYRPESVRANFGYKVQIRTDKRSNVTSVSGQVTWKTRTHKFKGKTDAFTNVDCNLLGHSVPLTGTCAVMFGTGTLEIWSDATKKWLPVASGVRFTLAARDAGKEAKKGGKQSLPDLVRIELEGYLEEDLPGQGSGDMSALKGGNISIR